MSCEEESRRVRALRVQWLYRYLDACRLERLYEEEVYLLGQTWREVGRAMGYCSRQVRRKHDKIVDALKMSTDVP